MLRAIVLCAAIPFAMVTVVMCNGRAAKDLGYDCAFGNWHYPNWMSGFQPVMVKRVGAM